MKAVVVLVLVVALVVCISGDPGNGNRGGNGQGKAKGKCNPDAQCICTLEYAPVCAEGVTYGNRCAAECACDNDIKIQDGPCNTP